MAKMILKKIAIVIISIILGFLPPAAIAMSYEGTSGGFPFGTEGLFFIWLISSVIISTVVRRFIDTSVQMDGKGLWEPPQSIRDRIVMAPQFVGRLDRKHGLLETTARMVEQDSIAQPTYWSQDGEDYNLLRLRGEILDQHGSPIEQVPVEISAKRKDWVGTIKEGDRIRVEGSFKKDGILHANKAFNFSTNSVVGSRK